MDTPEDRPPRLSTGALVVVAVLLAAPVVALMWVSSYARVEPRLWGFPFFYWYQFLWVFLTAITTSIAYRIVLSHERRRRAHSGGSTAADLPARGDGGSPR